MCGINFAQKQFLDSFWLHMEISLTHTWSVTLRQNLGSVQYYTNFEYLSKYYFSIALNTWNVLNPSRTRDQYGQSLEDIDQETSPSILCRQRAEVLHEFLAVAVGPVLMFASLHLLYQHPRQQGARLFQHSCNRQHTRSTLAGIDLTQCHVS